MEKIYDFIGVGIGPYNLSLAALTEDIAELEGLFFDEKNEMEWHPGMLIDGTDLQTSFIADLVTFADPTNKYSFLNYLHKRGRLYKFYYMHILEMPRQEYNDYLQWAAEQIDCLHFGKKVIDVVDHEDHYEMIVRDNENGIEKSYLTRHIVLATGAEPLTFEEAKGYPDEDIVHTSAYLKQKEELLNSASIVIVGSGQSAAEVFLDLLLERKNKEFELSWLTRSDGLFQKEKAKTGREFFSPDYAAYFHSLPFEKRKEALESLDTLRNGIDQETLDTIYEKLYEYSIGGKNPQVMIQPMTEVKGINKREGFYELECRQRQVDRTFHYSAEKVVLATGYKPHIPDWFLQTFKDEIEWEDDKLFKVGPDFELSFKNERSHRIYAVTNIEHSHGTASTSLSLAVNRSMRITNHMLGKEYYKLGGRAIFQQFDQL